MLFDIVPNLLSSLLSLLLPIFASYKALRTADPALLTPWLMYYIILSLFSLFEYWTYWVISYLPFYAYLRLFLLCYLVLPQTQGAVFLYQKHVHPFLARYEADIEHYISEAHDKAKKAGWGYVKLAVAWAQENLLGQKAREEPQSSMGQGGYAQNLLARFNLPSARQGLAAPKGDVYGMLSAAMGQLGGASGSSREAQVESMGRNGALIPEGMTSRAEKVTFVESQRERLTVLLSALDKEASELRNEEIIGEDIDRRLGEGGQDGIGKSRSGTPFERIERDEADGKPAGGSWMPWNNWGKQPASGQAKEAAKGRSSGIDAGS